MLVSRVAGQTPLSHARQRGELRGLCVLISWSWEAQDTAAASECGERGARAVRDKNPCATFGVCPPRVLCVLAMLAMARTSNTTPLRGALLAVGPIDSLETRQERFLIVAARKRPDELRQP
jgi:hypothetical protein